MVHGSGFRVQGSLFMVHGSGFRVQGLGLLGDGCLTKAFNSCLRVRGLGFGVQCLRSRSQRLRVKG